MGDDPSAYGRVVAQKLVLEGQMHDNVEKEYVEDEPMVLKAVKTASDEIDSTGGQIENISKNIEHVKGIETYDGTLKSKFVKPEAVGDHDISISEDKTTTDSFLNLKLERDEISRKEALQRLAEDNFKRGIKLFHYPEIVKPDQHIEIFFNRSFSTLKNEPDVMIMGAFNDWKWKSFTAKLSKSHLNGDWWTCHVHVPKEAYKIDFVFNNGEHVYDNNDEQDFCIMMEDGMDVFDFENLLLEEKRREQEEFARQKAEMERRAEEQRRIEAEKIAIEADRTQARDEVAKRRGFLQELMKKAMGSVDGVWYIVPGAFQANDVVRLYYNRSSGPLSHVNDIWIHGGHNGWQDGLSIVSKLIMSKKKDGDWWYAEGMYIIPIFH